MNIILIMIPLSLLVLIGAAAMFFWAVNKGQFDDMDSPGLMPLSDNLPEEESEEVQADEDVNSASNQEPTKQP